MTVVTMQRQCSSYVHSHAIAKYFQSFYHFNKNQCFSVRVICHLCNYLLVSLLFYAINRIHYEWRGKVSETK